MEVSWYLRFSRKAGVEVLADNAAYGQLKNTLYTSPGWSLQTEENNGHIRAAFVKQQNTDMTNSEKSQDT
ncbi:MAG: hypothetical protein ACNI27_03445 [Desulfovibrio sp.]